ncbi:MAG: transcriptional regulator GcvA [Geminicoccaceae bacterium]|nr:transcriptional regulator GcvA [Geminicoccaceae bacterium]
MASLRKALPPVNSLVVFESAARHLNFTHAAEELGVTQAAVSRQIHLLEEHLGAPLFERLPRRLKLTKDGERFWRAVSSGLDHIAGAATDIRRAHAASEVTIATSVTFASYWLMARLMEFRSRHPAVEIRLVAASPVRDLAAAGIDLAVRYGRGDWPGVESTPLFDNEIWPVCAPAYLQGRPPPASPFDLLDETLLHLGAFDRNWVTWETWLRGHGVEEAPRKRGLAFENYLVLLQSAARGEGIALCGRRLAEDFIARGEFVRPIDATLGSDRSFYLVQPSGAPLSRNAALFRDWLLTEAKRVA